MSKLLIEKLLRARESDVEAGGHHFTIRRPTDADALGMQGKGPIDFVTRFVVGWDLVELDVIPGGGAEKVPFDADLWAAWIVDHPELWEALGVAIVDAYRNHATSREVAEKN
jgi:hypothetical protein